MAVRAVTPHVVAISGHVQFHRDADGIDRWKDEWATGEDIYDPEYLPPLRHGRPFLPLDHLDSHRASDARPAQPALSADPMNAPVPAVAGRDGRAAGATSDAPSGVGDPSLDGSTLGTPSGGLSSPPLGTEASFDDVRPRGGHRAAP